MSGMSAGIPSIQLICFGCNPLKPKGIFELKAFSFCETRHEANDRESNGLRPSEWGVCYKILNGKIIGESERTLEKDSLADGFSLLCLYLCQILNTQQICFHFQGELT